VAGGGRPARKEGVPAVRNVGLPAAAVAAAAAGYAPAQGRGK